MAAPRKVLRRRKTLREIQEVLSSWRQSGMSAHAFAREHGYAVKTLYNWRNRYSGPTAENVSDRTGLEGTEPVLSFVPMRILSTQSVPPAPAATSLIELVVSQARVIRVPAGFDETTLKRLLRVLDGEAVC